MTALRKVYRRPAGEHPGLAGTAASTDAAPVEIRDVRPKTGAGSERAAVADLPAQPEAARAGAPVVARRAPPEAAPATQVPIVAFIDLEQDFRKAATLDHLRLSLVNGVRQLAPLDCAFLLERRPGLMVRGGRGGLVWQVTAGSSIGKIDRDAPFVRALECFVADLQTEAPDELARIQTVDLCSADAAVPATGSLAGLCRAFPHLVWIPLTRPDGQILGALAAFRQTAWQAAQTAILGAVSGPFGHAHAALVHRDTTFRQRLHGFLATPRAIFVLPIILAMLLMVPVRFSVLAPAEVVGNAPLLVTAPLDGVIREIAVNPGDTVEEGQLLISFNDTKLRNDQAIAVKNREVALAKYQRNVQSTVANHRDNQDITAAQADLAVAEAELELAQDMLNRAAVTAPRAGLAVFANRTDWQGKPVATGERIMEIVNPEEVEIRIDLAVADSMAVRQGTAVKLFLDGNPLGAGIATVSRIGYRPSPNAEQQMVYKIFAEFADQAAIPRLGARGTARIEGGLVPLGFYLFRRPLAALRQKLGI